MFKSEIVNRWIVLQQGENHSAIDEEPILWTWRASDFATQSQHPQKPERP
jgi:hypothetical protein